VNCNEAKTLIHAYTDGERSLSPPKTRKVSKSLAIYLARP
jgi:hypothetical protein